MKMKLGRTSILFLMVLSLIIVVSGCFFLPQRAGYVKILVYSGEPNSPSAVVKAMETLFVGIDGLQPFERYNIQILNSNGSLMAEYALNATEDGKLPPTPMWPDAGLPPVVDDGPVDPAADIQVGSYKIVLTGPNTDVTFPFSVISKNTPAAWSSNATGKIANSFKENDATDHVFVTGMNFPASKKVTVYIMRHQDIWTTGEFLDDVNTYVKKVTQVSGVDVQTDVAGKLGPVDLGVATIDAAHGNCVNFDIIVDANQDGYLDDLDAVDGRNAPGYTVQRALIALLKFQIASNGKALNYTTHWNDGFYYPDTFNRDGSGTGFAWAGYGKGVFCILNPLIDNRVNGLVPYRQVQVWVIKLSDYQNLTGPDYNLTGLDVSDSLGRPDLVTVQRTCSNGAGSILIWQAPLVDRRGNPYVAGTKYVVIVEKPNGSGVFDNHFDPNNDYVDGVLNVPDGTAQGFSVVGL